MNVNLVNDWRAILAKAWSVKFNIAAALFSAAEIIVPLIQPSTIPTGVFAGFAFLLSVGAPIVRIMAQKEVNVIVR